MFSNTSMEIVIHENEITWPDDIGSKFKRTPNSETTQWIDPENGLKLITFKNLIVTFLIRAFYCMDEACWLI